jgi:hypothetical protein
MNWILDFLGELLGLLLFILLLAALIAPFETLGWWSGWSKRPAKTPTRVPDRPVTTSAAPEIGAATTFIVFFTGILGFERGTAGGRESRLINLVTEQLPAGAVIIDDVFPYSVSNNPLNGERLLGGVWRWIDQRRRQSKNIINIFNGLIVVRNLFQVAVSADRRYGPLNNAGVAREVAHSLLRHGYPAGSGKAIHLVCYSGGGQISVGVGPYLHQIFQAPIRIISIGGVLTDDPGIEYVDQLTHLQGSKDIITSVGALLYPGRWPLRPRSAWNQAKREGRITVIPCGPMVHFGKQDYFSRHATFPDGQTYAGRVAELTAAAILNETHKQS